MNGDNEEFGGERFYQLAGQMHNYSSSRFIEGVINTLEEFKGPAPQHDDITIVAIKRII
jgi:serine phosphatase RsbU (regulator of sigma subunit)